MANLGAAASSHTHTKAQITDFPTTMTPAAHTHAASDVTSGTLAVARGGTGVATATANYVFAAPNGSNGAPAFRKLVAADIPALAASKITSGTLAVARGGTGVTSLSALKTSLGISAPTLVDVKSVRYIGGTSSKGLTITVTACDYVEIYKESNPTDTIYTGSTTNTYLFDYREGSILFPICTVYKGNNAYYDTDGKPIVTFSSDGTTLTFDEDYYIQYCCIYCYTGGNVCGTAALYLKSATTYSIPTCKRAALYSVYELTDLGTSITRYADIVAGGSAVNVSDHATGENDTATINSTGNTLTYNYEYNKVYRNAICYSV